MTQTIEPGILPLFRLFVALEILLLGLRIGLEQMFRSDFALVPAPLPSLAFLAALLCYLSWARLGEWLGRWYLPIALVASSVVALLAAAAGMQMRPDTGLRAEELVRGSWLLIVVLVVPLILVAWQYGFRWVLWFCALTAVAELALTLPIAAPDTRLRATLIVIALVRSLVFLPIGYAVARIIDAQRRQREALAEANARLARYATTLEQLAVSRERNRLAHELHDTLAHGLSSVAVQLEATSALWQTRPDEARAMLADALATSRTALGEARRAILALRASPLEDLGLVRALAELAQSTATRAGVTLDLQLPTSLDGLDTETEHALYRIAAEGIANVVRHAGARRLTVNLAGSDTGVTLSVADDGRGFDVGAASGNGRFGLYGMQERARLIGAVLDIESAPGAGTTVRLTVRRKK